MSRSQGKWYISIQTEQEISQPYHESTSIIGLDVGIVNFATLSNTDVFQTEGSRRHELSLKAIQRSLSRKQKFSQNWYKQKAKLAKCHRMIANTRRDFLNKTSTVISKNHAVIVLEDLRVSTMSRSARGTLADPGKNVAAKRGLNKSISEQGWSAFRRQLVYKQHWQGGDVIAVNPKNTSRCCSRCGHVCGENRKTQELFLCVACGHSENADVNAAKNILAAGHAVLACGEMMQLGHSVKQEPAVSAATAA